MSWYMHLKAMHSLMGRVCEMRQECTPFVMSGFCWVMAYFSCCLFRFDLMLATANYVPCTCNITPTCWLRMKLSHFGSYSQPRVLALSAGLIATFLSTILAWSSVILLILLTDPRFTFPSVILYCEEFICFLPLSCTYILICLLCRWQGSLVGMSGLSGCIWSRSFKIFA